MSEPNAVRQILERPQDGILGAANALVLEIIVEMERILGTPTKEWTIDERKTTMQALMVKAANASATLRTWIDQNISLKNMGKIGGSMDSIELHARLTSTSNSRNWGNATLKDDLQKLVEAFGNGCEYELPTLRLGKMQLSLADQAQQSQTKSLIVDPKDQPYTIADLMMLHNLSRRTVIRLYEDEPGVQILQSSPEEQRKTGKRRHRTIRVPHRVYLRVKHRMENR